CYLDSMSRRPALLGVLLSFFTCTLVAQGPKHFFWSVKNAIGHEAFLVGSLHVLTPDFYPLSPEIEKAFEGSRALVEEVNLDELNNPASVASLAGKAMFTDGRTLEQVISPATFAEVKRRAEKSGLPIAALQRMKPWMAAVALTTPMLTAAGFDTDLGIDRHFFAKAKAMGRQRWALESVAFQLDRFDQLSPALQEQMLTSTLADVDTQIANVKMVASAWARGDTKTIEQVLLTELRELPELFQRLLVDRNRNWLPQVESCLSQNSGCFIVVGAAHLVGPEGLPTLLAAKGYKVEQR
ncbi:MAG: TraB/GumN family protein, partial [Vicinamibacterales bacterium]